MQLPLVRVWRFRKAPYEIRRLWTSNPLPEWVVEVPAAQDQDIRELLWTRDSVWKTLGNKTSKELILYFGFARAAINGEQLTPA